MEAPKYDYTYWSNEDEERYERWALAQDMETYESLKAQYDAEGGDASMDLYPEDAEVPPVGDSLPATEDMLSQGQPPLSAMQQVVLEQWNAYPMMESTAEPKPRRKKRKAEQPRELAIVESTQIAVPVADTASTDMINIEAPTQQPTTIVRDAEGRIVG